MRRSVRSRISGWVVALLPLAVVACEDPSGLEAGAEMELVVTGLPALDPEAEGGYQAWVVQTGDTVSVGAFQVSEAEEGGEVRLEFTLPMARPDSMLVTLEPAGDPDDGPAPYTVLAGGFRDDAAQLAIEGAITDGRELVREPGAHSLFTSSNNIEMGYPSYENSGLWLFNIYPEKNKHGTREVHVTPLRRSWLYEGWIVYRYGTPEEVWISYGKFRPDIYGLLTSRDNTGSGPFSGDEDYLNGGVEDVPGDEWTTNLFGLELPGGFELPLILNEVDAETGEAVWTHVISIEPAVDENEPLYSGRPFLRPYRNPVGAGGPQVPRFIEYQDNDPTAVARLLRRP